MSTKTDPSAFLAVWNHGYRRASDISEAVATQIRRNWFDTLAATAAGVPERCTQAAWQACSVAGSDAIHPWDEALVLGTASHALDFDDVSMLATCHPSAPPIAALLALLPLLQRQRPSLSLNDVLAAYLVGTETTLRLGQWLGFRHYALGFHATATLGTVGAAAACAHALGLPPEQAHTALSIGASSSGGLRANFGTDVKPMHVGFAAAAAVRAALLAQAGAEASDDVWGSAGFFHAFNGGEPAPALSWKPGMAWAVETPGFEHKRFPSCYMTHRLIAGILKLRERQGAASRSQEVSIDIEVPKSGLSALKHPRPTTGLEAKFSGPYCAAAAWIDGCVELPSFSEDAVQRPALRAQMERVTLRERADAGESLESAPVNVTLRGPGWSDSIQVDWAPGSGADPMSREQFLGKWSDCAAHAGMDAGAAPMLRVLDAPLNTPAYEVLMPLHDMLLSAVRQTSKETL